MIGVKNLVTNYFVESDLTGNRKWMVQMILSFYPVVPQLCCFSFFKLAAFIVQHLRHYLILDQMQVN